MPTPDAVDVTPGSGAHVATYKLNEGGQDRAIQRNALNTSAGEEVSVGSAQTIDVIIQRPNDTTPYAIDDAWAKTTADVGGTAFAGASRAAGNSGLITDLIVFGSANVTPNLVGQLWLFDSAVTAIADNGLWTLSQSDLKKAVAVIDFTLATASGSPAGSIARVPNVGIGFKTITDSSLRGLVKTKIAYIPTANEQLAFRLKVVRTD